MTISEEAIVTIPSNNIPDFPSLILKNKNYRRAGIVQIVPRDAFKGKERKTSNGSDGSGLCEKVAKRVVYRVDEDKVSCVPDSRVNAILRGDKDKEHDYYIIGDGDDGDDIPYGYSREEYFLEKALASPTNVEAYVQYYGTAKDDDDNNSQDKRQNVKPQMSDMLVSKNPLLLKDKIDIEAMAKDVIKSREANQLAYQLSSRTSAYASIQKTDTQYQPLQISTDGAEITLHTMSDEERLRLEQRRKREEAALPYHLHGIELLGWESKINWEGIGGNSSDANKDEENNTLETSYPDPQEILSQPFNTSFEGMDLSKLISWEGADAKPGFNEALGRHLGKLILEDTVAATSVLKTSGVMPNLNPRPFNQSEEFKQRMESKGSGNTPISSLQTDTLKKKEEIEARQRKRALKELDKKRRIKSALGSIGGLDGGTGRAITSSLMGPGGTERTGRPTRHHGSSLAHDLEYIEQLDMINNHSLVKADLSPVELRHYYRPLLPRVMFTANEIMPWQLQIVVSPSQKSMNGKNAGGSTFQSGIVNVLSGSSSQSKIRNINDLCPSDGSLVLVEYSEQKPPITLMKGMASKIVNYYKGDKSKCPISAGGGDRPTKKKKHGLTNQDSDIKGSSGKVEKPPRLEGPDSTGLGLRDLIGKFKTSQKKHGDGNNPLNSSVTIYPEGVTEILKDDGPFLGKVMDGTIQTGIVNNLYVAPVFRHDPKPTDFLMIIARTKQQTNSSRVGVVLRPMPKNIFIAGQTEPKRKVYAPESKGDKDFMTRFTTYQIAKALQRKPLKFEAVKDGLFPYTEIPVNPLRQRIKKVAVYEKITQIWTLKTLGGDFDGIESLIRDVSAEDVAANWSARCAEQYLKDLGLEKISAMSTSVTNIGIAMTYLNGIVSAARKRKNMMRKLAKAKTQRKSNHQELFTKAKDKLNAQFEQIEKKVQIANFIYEELQLTPWNLTTDFMDVHKTQGGTGTMKLTGIGDPSGVSAGFNFMRETDKPNKAAPKNDSKDKKEITGTNKDLRKLSMKEMARILLEEYGVKQKDIQTLARWDRVHMIRELSTKAASDNAGDGMERYARGEKIKLRDKIDSYRKRIQEIWERQRSFLKEIEEEPPLEKSETLSKEDKGMSKDDDDDDDDNDDDDNDDEDYVDILKNRMQDTKKKNDLVRNAEGNGPHLKKNSSQDTAEDAGHLAAFIRERQEDQAVQATTKLAESSRYDGKAALNRFQNVDKKVIRKKITKTHPDGTQSITFKFIVTSDEEAVSVSKDANKKIGFGSALVTHKASQVIPGHLLFEEDETLHQVKKRSNRGRGRRSSNDGGDNPTPKPRRPPGSQSKSRKSQEKKRQKRKRDDDDDDDDDIYTSSKTKPRNNRKRETKPHVKMREALEDIRSRCEKRPNSAPFHRPVDRISCPTYYETISNPIDLQTIKNKIERYKYHTADAFIHDFEIMKNNANKFNGFGHRISFEANKIYEFVKNNIEANRDEFKAIEITVDEQYSSNRKRSRSTTPRHTETSGNPASVTVDGIEQQVFLGNLQGPFSDHLG